MLTISFLKTTFNSYSSQEMNLKILKMPADIKLLPQYNNQAAEMHVLIFFLLFHYATKSSIIFFFNS